MLHPVRGMAEGTPPASALARELITHARFDMALEQLRAEIANPHGASVLLLIAPAGFGKTKLLEVLENVITYEHRDAMLVDPDLRPAVTVEAQAPISGSFHWPLHLARILDALGEPGVAWRGPASQAVDLGPLMRYRRSREVKDLLLDTVAALQAHRTLVLSTDEAGHIAMVRDIERHRAQLEIIKSLANQSGARIVLAGTYDVLGFRHLSGQLARRMVEIHAPRYRANVAHELREFRRVATKMLNMVEDIDVVIDDALIETLYRGSLGCVGSLHQWLVRTEWAMAQNAGSGGFMAALQEVGWRPGKLKAMATELTAGEERLASEDAGDMAELDRLLGIGRRPASTTPAPRPGRPGARRRPGERKPERDFAGPAMNDGR